MPENVLNVVNDISRMKKMSIEILKRLLVMRLNVLKKKMEYLN